MTTYLVTGASGHLGRLAVERLIARGIPAEAISAGARDTSRLADLAAMGVRTVQLDYDDLASVDAALAGINRVLLVSGNAIGSRVAQHQAVIDAAARHGADLIVYTSAPRADSTTLSLAADHAATEKLVTASGVPYVILRNGYYTENLEGDLRAAESTGTLENAIPTGRIALASRVDFADAAAVVLIDDAHAGRTYELNGDTAYTYAEIAALIGDALGRAVTYRAVTLEERIAGLVAAGLDENVAAMFASFDEGLEDGGFDYVDDALPRLIGRATTPASEGLRGLLS